MAGTLSCPFSEASVAIARMPDAGRDAFRRPTGSAKFRKATLDEAERSVRKQVSQEVVAQKKVSAGLKGRLHSANAQLRRQKMAHELERTIRRKEAYVARISALEVGLRQVRSELGRLRM